MRGRPPRDGEDGPSDGTGASRAQAQIVGVSILLLVTVVSLGALTAGVGTVIDENAASADTVRVADGFATALDPVERTGRSREQVAFTEGRVRAVDRELRIIRDGRTVETLETDALVYEAGDETRVAYVAGAVIRGPPGAPDLHTPPPVTASRGDGGVLVVGAPRLGAGNATVAGSGGTTVPLRTDVGHNRTDLGTGRFRIAIETTTPDALAPYFREQGASVGRRDIDGDGVPSLVATYPGDRQGYLVVHDLNLRVGGAAGDTPTGTTTDDGDGEEAEGDDGATDDGDEDDGTLPVPPVPPVDPPASPVGPPDDPGETPPGEDGHDRTEGSTERVEQPARAGRDRSAGGRGGLP